METEQKPITICEKRGAGHFMQIQKKKQQTCVVNSDI